VRVGKNIPGDIESGDDDEDNFGQATFFVKYLCPVEECCGIVVLFSSSSSSFH
jgi:hypothetical protein